MDKQGSSKIKLSCSVRFKPKNEGTESGIQNISNSHITIEKAHLGPFSQIIGAQGSQEETY